MEGTPWGAGSPGDQPEQPPETSQPEFAHPGFAQPGFAQPGFGPPPGPPPRYGQVPGYNPPGPPPGYGQPPAPPGYGQPPNPPPSYGAQPGLPGYPQQPPWGNAPATATGYRRVNRFAAWAFGLGLGALIIGPIGLVAVVFGIIALAKIAGDHTQRGRWQAIVGIITGLILGVISTLVVVAIIVGSSHLSTSKVQSLIEGAYKAQGSTGVKVSCPANIPKKTGHVFFCTATAPNGNQMSIKVTETGGDNILYQGAG